MNSFHLIVLCQFIFVRGGSYSNGLHDCRRRSTNNRLLPLDDVRLKITSHGRVIQKVNLKLTECVLANENLPIWILNDIVDTDSLDRPDGSELEPINRVMQQLGKFTTYRDPNTASAAIYFHKRREFDGMINYQYIIQNLPVDEIHTKSRTSLILDRIGIYSRPKYESHTNDRELDEKDPGAGVNYQDHMKTYLGHVYEGFPEVLVIVSWDVAQEWTQKVHQSEFYTTIVSHVLTLFNGVGMLYSKLKNIKIDINIAGIIIGQALESFKFLQSCYYTESLGNDKTLHRLCANCVNDVLRRFLDAQSWKISPDSYDMVIFLTGENLYQITAKGNCDSAEIFQLIGGLSGSVNDMYQYRKYDEHVILVATVTSKGYLDRYPTIAHEMAHLMTVNHDKSSLFTLDGQCCGNLMKIIEKWCNKCLSWSETSEETFKLFFSSPNCCSFINQPRSLRPSRPSLMLTADEQCQCYGFQKAAKFLGVPWMFCEVHLQCWNKGEEIHSTVIPMDGTPCGNNKVCWDKRCQDL